MWQKMSHYAFKLYIQQQPFPKILIGFDFGMKSTGVAVTSSDLLHAFHLTTIKKDIRTNNFRQQIKRLILKQKPVGLVIGRPNFVVQSQQKESIIDLIDGFLGTISKDNKLVINYTFVDQSWTTLEAKQQLQAIEYQIRKWGHLRKEKELIDGMAAISILRKYLQFYNKN